MAQKISSPDKIYLDQAATSCPKAAGVGEAMRKYIDEVCANVNRSAYAPATEAAMRLLDTREQLCALFGFADPTHVIFTPGQTVSLNMVIKGSLCAGDHVLVSPLEHNGVMRPLMQMLDRSVSFDRIPLLEDERLDYAAARRLLKPSTRLMILTHASNVSGTVFPLDEASRFCREHGIALAVDAAQTAGHVPIDLLNTKVDALCIPSHKGLRGPSGIGALLLSPANLRRRWSQSSRAARAAIPTPKYSRIICPTGLRAEQRTFPASTGSMPRSMCCCARISRNCTHERLRCFSGFYPVWIRSAVSVFSARGILRGASASYRSIFRACATTPRWRTASQANSES